jgi:hypothetical protein
VSFDGTKSNVHNNSIIFLFKEMKPFIEMSVVQRIIPHSTVKQFKYMKILTQEFHVKVDLIFLNEIFEMLSSETTEEESVSKKIPIYFVVDFDLNFFNKL